MGGIAIDNHGSALPDSTLKLCEESDSCLFGSVGGPKWESLPAHEQERAALLPFVNISSSFVTCPAKVYSALAAASPLHPDITWIRCPLCS